MKVGGKSVEGSLHFAVTSGVLAGTFTRSDGNEQELKNIEIKRNDVAWDVEGAGGKQHAKAKVEGSSMRGTLKRSGGGGRRGGRGSGGRRGGGGGTTEITFIAYKSVPPVETVAPVAAPTPAS